MSGFGGYVTDTQIFVDKIELMWWNYGWKIFSAGLNFWK